MNLSMLSTIAICLTLLSGTVAQDWTQRLESLTPDRPFDYFLLGEEVADVAESDADRALARQLYGLAGAIAPERLGRSAALALADLEVNPQEKRRLLALAELLDSRVGDPNWLILSDEPLAAPGGAVQLSEAFGYYRRGLGGRTLVLLEKSPEASSLLSLYGHLIGGEPRFLENAKRYRTGESPIQSDPEIVDMLLLEEALLSGDERRWSSELLLYEGRTLVEVSPDQLDDAFDVNTAMPYYRNGRWVTAGSPSRPGTNR